MCMYEGLHVFMYVYVAYVCMYEYKHTDIYATHVCTHENMYMNINMHDCIYGR
jgi:hypothetical protein